MKKFDYQIDPDELEKKLPDFEDRSRRWLFIDKLKLENDIIIEKAHRAKKKKKCKYGKKDQPRIIVCKLLSYKQKFKVLQNCKKLKR